MIDISQEKCGSNMRWAIDRDGNPAYIKNVRNAAYVGREDY